MKAEEFLKKIEELELSIGYEDIFCFLEQRCWTCEYCGSCVLIDNRELELATEYGNPILCDNCR